MKATRILTPSTREMVGEVVGHPHHDHLALCASAGALLEEASTFVEFETQTQKYRLKEQKACAR
jgi:hypothetical protein